MNIRYLGSRVGGLLLAALVAVQPVSAREAQGTGTVYYSPADRTVQGEDARTGISYVVQITSPSTAGVGAFTPQLVWSVEGVPDGVDPSEALSYVSHAPASITFNGPNEVQSVTISVQVPADAVGGDHQYKLKATGWAGEGSTVFNNGTDINVRVLDPVSQIAKPTISIITPEENQVFTYYVGGAPVEVPLYVYATAAADAPIDSLTATLGSADVQLNPTGLGTDTALGQHTFSFTEAGIHTVTAVASNAAGQAETQVTFEVVVVEPTPAVQITDPLHGQIFSYVAGEPLLDLPFSFTATTNPQYTVDAVSATLDGQPVTLSETLSLGTVAATGSGVLPDVTPGDHVLVATAVSAGVTVSSSITFTVQQTQPPSPPTVVINSPAPDAEYTLAPGGVLTVPLVFTGTSTVSGGAITELAAQLGDVDLTVTSDTLGQASAVGQASLVITAPGTYALSVSATDAIGTAFASQNLVVVRGGQQAVDGLVFLDSNYNGLREPAEAGLGGLAVTLKDADGVTVASTTTAGDGAYSFSVASGDYLVVVAAPAGLSPTTLNEHEVSTGVGAPDTGFALDFEALAGLKACGNSHGFWKTNLSKALAGKSSGTQVSAADLQVYTQTIANFALSPFEGLSLSQAVSILNGSDQLKLQLLASEYNYVSGRWIGDSEVLTRALVYHGEYVVVHRGQYSAAYQEFLKDWFDAYNNSHCGWVAGPSPYGEGDDDSCEKGPKSGKWGKSDKSSKSPKWGKSDKSSKSDKSDKSGKSDKSVKAPKWGKSDKGSKSGKGWDHDGKSGKSGESHKSGKSDKAGKYASSGKKK